MSLVGSTIKGSQPAFASGDVVDDADATDIHSITEWHSLSPSSVIRTAIGASCDALSPCGERCGFTLSGGMTGLGKSGFCARRCGFPIPETPEPPFFGQKRPPQQIGTPR